MAQWHRALLRHVYPDMATGVVDISDWFAEASRGEFYYLRYLALFVHGGILFENFVAGDAEERRFARERVQPSFRRAVEIFGVPPLIVPLLPIESEQDDRWRRHRGELYQVALELLWGAK